MPRALIISTGDLYLQPLKALFDSNKVTYTYIDIANQVSGAEEIRISEVLAGTDNKHDCVFISGAQCHQIIHDTDIEHCFAIYSLPETYLLSKAIKSTDSLAQFVAEWQQQSTSYLKAIEKSEAMTLVSLDDVLANSGNFLKEIFEKEENSKAIVKTDIATQLLDIGVKASLVDRDDLYELYDALLSQSHLFGGFSVHLSPDVQIFQNEAHSLIEIAKAFNEKSTEVAQLKSQLDELSINSNYLSKELSEQLQVAESALEEKEVLALELVRLKENTTEEMKRAELNAFQLQEELEATFSELQKVKVSQNKQKQEAGKNVAELQSELAKKNKEWSSKFQKVEEEKERLLKELKGVAQLKAEELKQCELQTFQLQEELEVTFLELETLKNKTHTLTGGEDLDAFISAIKSEKLLLKEQISLLEKDLEQQVGQSETKGNQVKEELELATLQILQLQEELEFYYLQAVEESKLKGIDMQKSIIGKSFDSVSIGSVSVVGQYVENDYRDLHLVLECVNYPHCGIIDTLNVKLVNISGKTGIEFRTDGNPDNLFNLHDDCEDEYGPYLRYFPDAPEFLIEQQGKIKQRLNASEKLLTLCTLNCIQKALIEGQLTNDAGVDDSVLKEWKLALADLELRKYYPIEWLSFDGVAVKECFAMDGYEHLWLQFNNILAGDVLRRKMDIKLCAKSLTEKGDGFLASFFLEFRVNTDGTEPLYAWPPETSDEYGPKLEIGLLDDLTNLRLTKEDVRLISLIRDNIQSILIKCDTNQATLTHSIDAWCHAIEKSLQSTNEAEFAGEKIENEDVDFIPPNRHLSVEEVVDLSSYQHVVFSEEESQLKIKLRADNINKETFDAEVCLELRDGTKEVIYNATEYFDIDDYGPRVKIPAEILEPLSTNTEYDGELKWAASCYRALAPAIEKSDEVDQLLKVMWLQLLERKKQN
jgi:hypothetical protein|tara:strand:+ start:1058 stop:3862 length:2805 start_codon:yes stop_codon:yes gene_type:complete